MKEIISIFLIVIVAGCNHPEKAKTQEKAVPAGMQKDSTKTGLKNLSFAVKKDLVCGMPVSAGVSDTLHYKGKIYGFCAVGCKDEFIKSPETYLTAK